MGRYILKRLILFFPVIFGVVTLVFFLIHLMPGDPVEVMLGETALSSEKEDLRKSLGLDKGIGEQYLIFLKNARKGDLGKSVHTKRPVLETVIERYPATLELTIAALIIAILISIPAGIISAVKKDSFVDRGFMLFALLGVSIPNFWLGPLLIILFSIQLGWLPVAGRESIYHLILPAITLGMGMSAILSRMTRASMLEVLNKEYIITARAKGLSSAVVIMKHAFRNALIPVVTVIGLQFGALLAGAVITETIFSWPGIGRLMIQGIYTRDYPIVQGCILIIALSYVLINLITDILYSYIDPRIKYEK
ncbi:MAG: nickel ABC transporter permease [Nitrospirota bacterium]